jgi:hypothetical protein
VGFARDCVLTTTDVNSEGWKELAIDARVFGENAQESERQGKIQGYVRLGHRGTRCRMAFWLL